MIRGELHLFSGFQLTTFKSDKQLSSLRYGADGDKVWFSLLNVSLSFRLKTTRSSHRDNHLFVDLKHLYVAAECNLAEVADSLNPWVEANNKLNENVFFRNDVKAF